MCGLDHAHVIGTITNRQQDGLLILFHQFDNLCLLKWRDTTCDKTDLVRSKQTRVTRTTNDSFAEDGQFEEDFGEIFLQGKGQALPVCTSF